MTHPTAGERALRRERAFPESWLAWTLRVALVALIAWDAFSPSTGQAQDTGAPWGVLVAAAAFALFADLARAHDARPLKRAEAVWLAMISLHAIGQVFGLYRSWEPYDLVVHFVNSALAVYVLYEVAIATRWPWLWRWGTPAQTAVLAFALVVTLGVFWEFFEVVQDVTGFGNPVRNYYGSVADLAADSGGALVGALVAARRWTQPPEAR